MSLVTCVVVRDAGGERSENGHAAGRGIGLSAAATGSNSDAVTIHAKRLVLSRTSPPLHNCPRSSSRRPLPRRQGNGTAVSLASHWRSVASERVHHPPLSSPVVICKRLFNSAACGVPRHVATSLTHSASVLWSSVWKPPPRDGPAVAACQTPGPPGRQGCPVCAYGVVSSRCPHRLLP